MINFVLGGSSIPCVCQELGKVRILFSHYKAPPSRISTTSRQKDFKYDARRKNVEWKTYNYYHLTRFMLLNFLEN